MFINGNEINNSRIYGINFYDLGVPTTVVIDDYLPFSYSTGASPVFTQPTDNKGLWAMYLEKAFSKYHGNFYTIEGGSPHRALEAMTSFPGKWIALGDVLKT